MGHIILKLDKYPRNKTSLKYIPQNPGIYIFWDKTRTPIYVGKAINLRKRLESYFSDRIIGKTALMVNESANFSIINVSSEVEALLLEAKLVNSYQTKFNSQLKDDKHPLYIKITNDSYPLVLTARKMGADDKSVYFGPFPSTSSVKAVLKMIRKIFPFSQHKIGKRACIYSQIGLCNPCPNEIEKVKNISDKKKLEKIYKNNIFMIKTFLSGNLGRVIFKLDSEMKSLANKQDFEAARQVREKIRAVEYVTQPITPVNYFLGNPNFLEDVRKKELTELTKIIKKYLNVSKTIARIECYDVAHLSGTNVTASMVTFVDGEPDKNLYRHFKIVQAKGGDDISSLREIAQRRIKNIKKWGLPDLIVVDGGKGQLGVFLGAFKNIDIPIVALAKREETLVFALSLKDNHIVFRTLKLPRGGARNLLQRIRNEAHRFARRYHFNLVKKMLMPNMRQKKK